MTTILQEAISQGIHFEVNGDRLKIKSTRPIPTDLVEQLRAHKQQIIEALSNQTRGDEYSNKGEIKKCDLGGSDSLKRYCEGYQPPRYVHPELCKWHTKEGDPHCAKCKHLSLQDKQVWMDAYLDRAIARLNAYYKPGDKIDWDRQGARQRIDQVEQRIIKAFLAYDIETYKDLVNKWQQIFKEA